MNYNGSYGAQPQQIYIYTHITAPESIAQEGGGRQKDFKSQNTRKSGAMQSFVQMAARQARNGGNINGHGHLEGENFCEVPSPWTKNYKQLMISGRRRDPLRGSNAEWSASKPYIHYLQKLTKIK